MLHISPISSREMRSLDYKVKKSVEISQAVRKYIFDMDPNDLEKVDKYDEMITQLKQKYNLPSTDRNDQLRILSVLPQSMSARKISEEFNAPRYMVKQMKKLVAEEGILCTTEARRGHGINETTKQKVIDFYDSDDISRAMPGTNDFVSELQNGRKERVQKRLLMMSLSEAYNIFQESCQDIKVGFTLFTQLRPKHCVLLDKTGTHNVCVCTIHENVNLMHNCVKMVSLSEIFESMMCDPSIRTTECFSVLAKIAL